MFKSGINILNFSPASNVCFSLLFISAIKVPSGISPTISALYPFIVAFAKTLNVFDIYLLLILSIVHTFESGDISKSEDTFTALPLFAISTIFFNAVTAL